MGKGMNEISFVLVLRHDAINMNKYFAVAKLHVSLFTLSLLWQGFMSACLL